ncbi:MAG: methionine--tRNA ligase [Deltaproteobacteria bacterium]|nr:methionine--tRNA ligase [Deltaproteobacteria bacterium]
MKKPHLVTAALPYANGSIHIGHLVEYVMTDIWVRALGMAGEEAYFVCADDTHGTPVELAAEKAGISPEAFIAKTAEEHIRDFTAFGIHFDSYYSTNSEENRRWVHEIYGKLKAKDLVRAKWVEQLFDETASRFLPDRFVRGECPRCHAKDQYGDVCEVCNSTYSPTELIEPYSSVTGTKPVMKQTEHLFVELAKLADFLKEWTGSAGRLQPEIKNFVDAWLATGLTDWCISRDAPYFGFRIPDRPDKFFYVWIDAPVGYIASTENLAKKLGRPDLVDEMWRRDGARVTHVIGKDIVYFHTLFWPAMLFAAGLTLPERVHVHGMLTVDGVKMSKSRGTFVLASTYLRHLDPAYLRYYYASKTGPKPEDVDLSLEELSSRVNAELVNNVVNLIARGVPFISTKLGGKYGKLPAGSEETIATARGKIDEAVRAYGAFDLASAVRAALEVATIGNKLFQDAEPWKRATTDPSGTLDTITLCLNLGRAAITLLAPVVPDVAARAAKALGVDTPRSFEEALAFDLVDRPVGPTERLLDRLDRKKLEQVIEESKVKSATPEPEKKAKRPAKAQTEAREEAATPATKPAETKPSEIAASEANPAPQITIDEFAKVDLRVGLVRDAKLVEGADKLLELSVDLGEAAPRTVFAGIRSAYSPEQVIGRKVAVVANLKPRKMRFGTSQGMVLAAGPGGKDIWLLSVPEDAPPGSEIK